MGIIVTLGVLLFFGLIVVGLILYLVGIYNSLVTLKNDIDRSFANIDVLLKQRADELPKLIETVKGYAKFERRVLTQVTQARTAFLNASTMPEKAKADGMLSGALKSLFAVAESYPTLKANENFVQLQTRISGIENELADRREFYNDSVNTFNIKIQSVPDMFIARMLGYVQPEPLFQATEAEKKDVNVDFSDLDK